jgi:hypothetical protein
MCARRVAPNEHQPALSVDDLIKLLGIVFAIVGTSTTFLYITISRAEGRLDKRIEDKFEAVRTSVDQQVTRLDQINEGLNTLSSDVRASSDLTVFRLERIEQALGVPPVASTSSSAAIPPAEAPLWVPVNAGAAPLSTYSVDDSMWEGVWVELSDSLAEQLGFRTTFFSPLSDKRDLYDYTSSGFSYVATFLSYADPEAQSITSQLVEQGWQEVPLQNCVGPSEYGLLISPALAGLPVAFELDQIPSQSCDRWRAALETGSFPP